MKHRIFLAAAGVLTAAVLLTTGVFLYARRFGVHGTGLHEPVNALPEKIGSVTYFAGGDLYRYQNGTSTLWGKNVYDPADDEVIPGGTYALTDTQLLYNAGGDLILSDGNGFQTLATSVTGWRTAPDLLTVAYTLPWQTNKNPSFGALYRRDRGMITPLDTGVAVSSLSVCGNGAYVFALKNPGANQKLMRYDKKGKGVCVGQQPLLYCTFDGETVVMGKAGEAYTLWRKSRQITFDRVFYADLARDESVLYLLADYNAQTGSGTLTAVDLFTLKTKVLSYNVHFFDVEGVSHTGVLYSKRTNADMGLYEVWYAPVTGKPLRLMHNTDENALYRVALNSRNHSAYLIAKGARKEDGGLYHITFHGNKITEQVKLAEGYIDSLVYYEQTDSVTFLLEPDAASALWRADATASERLLASCGALYHADAQSYEAQAVLSGDNKKVMYFTDVVASDTVRHSGTLWLNDVKIAEEVAAQYMAAPITDAGMTEIYYLKQSGRAYDLFRFANGTSTLLARQVQGLC